MDVPSAIKIAEKWIRVTPLRSEDFENGVRNPIRDWADATADAEDNYEAGVKEAITKKRFGKGVRNCGTAKQKQNTIIKGIPRWSEGVVLGKDAMQKGMEMVVNVLKATTLPKRYPAGDPRNLKRVEVIAVALHKAKVGA